MIPIPVQLSSWKAYPSKVVTILNNSADKLANNSSIFKQFIEFCRCENSSDFRTSLIFKGQEKKASATFQFCVIFQRVIFAVAATLINKTRFSNGYHRVPVGMYVERESGS